MRLDEPRIAPLKKSDWTGEQRELLERYENEGRVLNIFSTLALKPDAARSYLAWGGYVMRRSSLSDIQREILILRIGWLCKSGYEFAQHSRLALRAGLPQEDIERLKVGAEDPYWSDEHRTLIRAADELHEGHFVSDATWRELDAWFSDEQKMDIVYVVGHYTQTCMILNSFGIQVEPETRLDPELKV